MYRELIEEARSQSEERYRAILSGMEDGYFEVDLAGNMLFSNEANDRIFGYQPGEQKGLNYRDYTDPEEANKVFQVFNQVYRTLVPHKGFEWVVNNRNGEKVYVETSVSPMLDANRQPIGFRGILRDITPQKRAQTALRESEEKYRSILESIEEGYYEVDLDGNHVFFNDAFCYILGTTRKDLQGTNYQKLGNPSNDHEMFKMFNRVFRTGEPVKAVEWEIFRKDGSKRLIELSISIRNDPAGKPIGFKGIARDMSERKEAEKALTDSEVKYRTLFNVAQIAIFLISEDRFVDCNSHSLKVFACSREQIIGKGPFEFSPPISTGRPGFQRKRFGKNKGRTSGGAANF